MSYTERTEEWAPNPEKQEAIFVTAMLSAFIKAGKLEYTDALGSFAKRFAEEWRGYTGNTRKGKLQELRDSLVKVASHEELSGVTALIAAHPQTSVERKTTMEIYNTAKERLDRAAQQ